MSDSRTSVWIYAPATSANLGPGFDALGVALGFGLTCSASVSESWSIVAVGRDVDKIADTDRSLVIETYRSVLAGAGIEPFPLRLVLDNGIPLGMGCGSSAAALVTGVALANHFGKLGWSRERILLEASVREGHPDNVAACVLGGMTVSSMQWEGEKPHVQAASLSVPANWRLSVVVPAASRSTEKARAMLPERYSRTDAVFNVQNAAMVVAAFALGRGDLLHTAMRDRMHQPYRSEACPLLPALESLSGREGVLGVSLSGAGPSVLLVTESGFPQSILSEDILVKTREAGQQCELLQAGTAAFHRLTIK